MSRRGNRVDPIRFDRLLEVADRIVRAHDDPLSWPADARAGAMPPDTE